MKKETKEVKEVSKTPIEKTIEYHMIPTNVLIAARQVLGKLPYDQVSNLCLTIDAQAKPVK